MNGLSLSKKYYFEIVKPILEQLFPNLKYSCGLIGTGSEVLGFDDETSQDHHWGPRLMLFLGKSDLSVYKKKIDITLRKKLPVSFHGFETNFGFSDVDGVRLMRPGTPGEVNHFIEIFTIEDYFKKYLGIDIYQKISNLDWLSLPQQMLLSIQSGSIFHDNLGLISLIKKLEYYPKDIWLYLMASSWQRVGQEEHLAARTFLTGQYVGYNIIAFRLIKDIIYLGFLLEKRYAPYAKWLEKGFVNLKNADKLIPFIETAKNAEDPLKSYEALCRSFEILATIHNKLNITDPINNKRKQFHGRSFEVIHGNEIARTIIESITDPEVKGFVKVGLIGNIDQISDNTDVVEYKNIRRKLIYSIFGLDL